MVGLGDPGVLFSPEQFQGSAEPRRAAQPGTCSAHLKDAASRCLFASWSCRQTFFLLNNVDNSSEGKTDPQPLHNQIQHHSKAMHSLALQHLSKSCSSPSVLGSCNFHPPTIWLVLIYSCAILVPVFCLSRLLCFAVLTSLPYFYRES